MWFKFIKMHKNAEVPSKRGGLRPPKKGRFLDIYGRRPQKGSFFGHLWVVFWTFMAANKCPFLPLRAEIFKKRRFSRPD